jgi:hypothetical protein
MLGNRGRVSNKMGAVSLKSTLLMTIHVASCSQACSYYTRLYFDLALPHSEAVVEAFRKQF